MSIIVAVNKGGRPVSAADTMHFYGSRREHTDNLTNRPKVRKIGASYVGGVGWSVYDNIMLHYFRSRKHLPALNNEMAIFDCFLRLWRALKDHCQIVNDQLQKEDESPFASLDSEFLVVNRHGIFQVDRDLTAAKIPDPFVPFVPSEAQATQSPDVRVRRPVRLLVTVFHPKTCPVSGTD